MRSRNMVALLAAPLLTGACHDGGPVAPPFEASTPAILRSIASGPFRLGDNGSFAVFAARVASLDARLPRATVSQVLADGNRDARESCDRDAGSAHTAFCWNSGDDGTDDWYPQGLTASWDAAPDGLYAGHTAILASWYHKGDKGVRISFVNYDRPATVTYRHVLLVEPISASDFRAVGVHAGGIVWYGDYLYVMDTGRGIRVFDLRHIWRTEADPQETHIGLHHDGTYHAFNYRYVLPQVGEYAQISTGKCDPIPLTPDEPLCFSYSGLDRSTTPPSILVGEYYNGEAGARLVRFPIDTASSLLATDAFGQVTALAAYRSPRHNLQGALSSGGTYLMTRSRGDKTNGLLYRTRLDASDSSGEVPPGPEDLSYQSRSGRVWALAEHPDKRQVFWVAMTLP